MQSGQYFFVFAKKYASQYIDVENEFRSCRTIVQTVKA